MIKSMKTFSIFFHNFKLKLMKLKRNYYFCCVLSVEPFYFKFTEKLVKLLHHFSIILPKVQIKICTKYFTVNLSFVKFVLAVSSPWIPRTGRKAHPNINTRMSLLLRFSGKLSRTKFNRKWVMRQACPW